jgi:ADP-ribose pyrophosphatase
MRPSDTAVVHARRHTHQGRVIDVGVEDVTLPSGVRTTLDVIKHPGASCVLPISADGDVVLLRQFRHCAGGSLWEAPAGTLNPGEDPLTCAHRELAEEAGLKGTLSPAGYVFTAPGFCDEKIYLWLARDCEAVPTQHDVDEVITEVRRFTGAEVREMIRDGSIADAKTLSVLARWLMT